jgi:TusA-related sulfurtransferase
VELEEYQIPSQGAGDVLYVYTDDVIVTHDIRRTLKVFEGDAEESIVNIRSFVLEGILGTPSTSR